MYILMGWLRLRVGQETWFDMSVNDDVQSSDVINLENQFLK